MNNLNYMKTSPSTKYEIGQDKLTYFPEWSVKDDKTLYNKVYKLAHSNYDSSKFTKSGNYSISDNGIAKGLDTTASVTPDYTIDTSKTWEVKFDFTVTDNSTSGYISNYTSNSILDFYHTSSASQITISGTGVSYTLNFGLTNGVTYTLYFGYDGTNYYIKLLRQSDNTLIINHSATGNTPSKDHLILFQSSGVSPNFCTVDLKTLAISSNGVTSFTGNKTAVDTLKGAAYTTQGSPTISNEGDVSGIYHQ